ncbi:MAG: Mur ligase family protein [Thermoleophilia bacterium]|nr:Mur ligase family protein [Thermoleophilia bacterium]
MGAVGPNTQWLESLSPWPLDGFGLERMHALLEALGGPQSAYEAVHVVGTNGKSTATRTVEALLLADGLSVGATVSPHVRSWDERVTIGGAPTDVEVALGRVRPAAERLAATQFEVITAAALAAFAEAAVDAAVVEAGLGGRFDATNVLRSRVVLLTNVSLEHTDVLGDTVEAIAHEKLAVAHPESIVVLPDSWFGPFVPAYRELRVGGAHEAAEAFAGHHLPPAPPIALPGRLESRPGEIRDGAHNADGVRWLLERLPPGDHVVCASILGDKDVDGMLAGLARAGTRFVATTASNPRALMAGDLAAAAGSHFAHVEAVADPTAALRRAHELGGPVLVTGSLYLLADLERAEADER